MPDPTRGPDDPSPATGDDRAEREAPTVPRTDAGPRAGEHPTVARQGSGRSVPFVFAALLVGAALMLILIWVAMLVSG